MTSSSSYELWVAQGAERVEVKAGALDPTASTVAPVEFRTDRTLELGVRRPDGLTTGGRVRLGDQVLVVLPPGQDRIETRVPELREEWGEADFVYEEFDPDDPAKGNVLLRLTVLLRTRPDVEALYEHLVEDLEQWASLSSLEIKVKPILASLACHGAVRAGRSMALPEIKQLVQDWVAEGLIMTCPHGRRVAFRLSNDELGRLFDRA